MTITILDPEVQAYIRGEIESGHFTSADSVVDVAMKQFISDCRPAADEEIDDATVSRLNEAFERGERNEGGYTPEEALAIILGGKEAAASVRP